MKYYNDITAMHGDEAEAVDVIIGGFPLIWREINGADSVPWACEIDEYCRAVTQRRLP